MAVQPLACVQALAAHHLPGMKLGQQRALLLRADNKDIEENATIEVIASGTAKARIGTATAEIYMCLADGARVSGDVRGMWVGLHLRCCLREAARSLDWTIPPDESAESRPMDIRTANRKSNRAVSRRGMSG
jgi:hypothetical protein